MSEPKYKVGDVVETKDEDIFKIRAIEITWYHEVSYQACFDFIDESNIKNLVKIVPDYGEVFCKDCKHCVIEDDYDFPDKKSVEFKDCPISDWFESVWYTDSDFYEYGGYICDFDTLQPPPNCNCFEPKEEKK